MKKEAVIMHDTDLDANAIATLLRNTAERLAAQPELSLTGGRIPADLMAALADDGEATAETDETGRAAGPRRESLLSLAAHR